MRTGEIRRQPAPLPEPASLGLLLAGQPIDATIVYPGGAPDFWALLCGRVPCIVVRVQTRPIPPDFASADYAADPAFRRRFHRWLHDPWREKDELIEALRAATTRAEAPD